MGIIGRPFKKFINDQVKKRQEALGEGFGGDFIKTKSREAFMTATPFIRLASSVVIENDSEIKDREEKTKKRTIDAAVTTMVKAGIDQSVATKEVTKQYNSRHTEIPGKSVAQQIKENGLFDGTPSKEWMGEKLAQKCILLGTPTAYTRDSNGNYTSTPIAGANNVSGAPFGNTPDQFSSAYGWGYNSTGINYGRGYIPPPGITNVDFEYKNDGALAQATVNIKAFSPEQFAIIDILYMRPGFTVLLEFGHSTYLNNSGGLESLDTSSSLPFDYLFDQMNSSTSTKPTYSEMAKKIVNEKDKRDGNYEGFFGRITKFNWKFNNDGSYDITVKLTGTGDVINSLNTNLSKMTKTSRSILTNKSSGNYTKEFGKPTDWQKYQGARYQLPDGDGNTDTLEATYTVGFSHPNYDVDEAEEEGDFIISDAFESQLNYEFYQIFNDATAFPGNGKTNSNAKTSPLVVYDVPILGKNYTRKFNNAVIKMDVDDAGGTEYSPITLVKFGCILSMIQKICNITDGKENVMIQFEMVRNIFAKSIKNTTQGGNSLYPDNSGYEINEDETYMASFPGNMSADPNVCMKSFGQANNKIAGKKYSDSTYSTGLDTLVGKIMSESSRKVDGRKKLVTPFLAYRLSQVWINLNFVTTLLKDLRGKDESEKQEVPLLDLIQGILTGINESCGGINNFRVISDEETSEIKILSESPALIDKTTVNDKERYTVINTYGFDTGIDSTTTHGSFVTNLDLNSELSDKMATQITIGAASNNNSINGDGAVFASYSKGLKDAMFVQKQSVLQNLSGGKDQTPTERIDKIMEESSFHDAAYEIYGNNQFDEDGYITTLKSVNSSIAPKIMDQYFNKGLAPSPSFLPFNLSLTMHGLGGIRIYDAFKIDGKVLPLSYNPKDIKLIIKSLSHSVSLDGWKTTLSTLSVPDNDAYESVPASDPATNINPTGGGGGGGGVRQSGNSKLKDCEVLMIQGFDTPDTYGGKAIRKAGTNSSIHMNKWVRKEILPLLESTEFKKKYTKGLRMFALVKAIKEGYKPGSRSYKTKNPGNIGNTDSGANKPQSSLKVGLTLLLDYIKGAGNGTKSGWAYGPKTIPQYYSNEIAGNPRNYQRPDGCLPGYTGNYQGQLGFFTKKYATFARVNNNTISELKTIFKYNGYGPEIDGNTLIPTLIAYNPNTPIKTSK
jgi:hypothetical protein